MQSIFRVDAGPRIGLGHLTRCLSVAAALDDLGTESIFLTSEDPTVRSRIKRFGFEMEFSSMSGTGDDIMQTLSLAERNHCRFVIVDSYRVDAPYLARLRTEGLYVAAIDDLARYVFPCQLVINGGAHASQLRYQSSSGDTRFLLGPEYALLRPEFWDVPLRAPKELVHNIVVTLGGGDPYDLMPRLIALLDRLPEAFTLTAITGPFFDNVRKIKELASAATHRVNIVESPESLFEIIADADLAISAGGQTLYELAATGTPSIAIQVADNQEKSLKALEAKGVVRVSGDAEDATIMDKIEEDTLDLVRNASARKAMSSKGCQLVDGRGAARVAREIMKDISPSTT